MIGSPQQRLGASLKLRINVQHVGVVRAKGIPESLDLQY